MQIHWVRALEAEGGAGALYGTVHVPGTPGNLCGSLGLEQMEVQPMAEKGCGASSC